jgi:hypothetical protein
MHRDEWFTIGGGWKVDVRGVVGGECHGMIGKEVYLGHVV